MALIFPPNWSALHFPDARWALLDTLRELSDPDYQRKAWIERSVDAHMILGIDQVFHFFFDDAPLCHAPDDFDLIGSVFFDKAEADAITSIKRLLSSMLDDLGDADNEAFLNHPLWPELVRCAQTAKALLDSRGVPRFESE